MLVASDGTTPLRATVHRGADSTRPAMRNWLHRAGSPDADLVRDRPILASGSRDLERNTGLVAGATRTYLDSVIGAGLSLSPRPLPRAFGGDEGRVRAFIDLTEELWPAYADGEQSDAMGVSSLHDKARQTVWARLHNGDALHVVHWVPDVDGAATKLQTVESDRLSNPQNQPDSETLIAGVQLGPFARPVGYHVRNTHPGDVLRRGGYSWTYLEARTRWNRRRVLHIYENERAEGHRGRPLFAPILESLVLLNEAQTTEAQTALANSLIMGVMQSDADPVTVAQMFGLSNGLDQAEEAFAWRLGQHMQAGTSLRGGKIIHTLPGEEFVPFTPSRTGVTFQPYIELLLKTAGAGVALPLELFLKDFSKSNYSSARAALIEAWRTFLTLRSFVARTFYAPVYGLWLEERISAGDYAGIIDLADFYRHRPAVVRARWRGQGRGSVDPVKEMKAFEIALGIGVMSWRDVCEELGMDYRDVFEQRAREAALAKSIGLDLPNITETEVPEGFLTDAE